MVTDRRYRRTAVPPSRPGGPERAGPGGSVAALTGAPAPVRHPSRRTLVLIVGPILAVVVVGTLGNMFHPALLRDHPLWLVAMEPRNRFLLLVAGRVDFVPFLVVATLRRLSSDPLFFLLGALYGDAGVRWVEHRMGDNAGILRTIERAFARAAPVMVFLFPGAVVCVLAGATGMRPVLFVALNLAGTVVAVTAVYRFAEVFDGPLGSVNRFYGENTRLLTALSIMAVVAWFWLQRRRGTSELQTISAIEHELEAEAGDGRPSSADDDGGGR